MTERATVARSWRLSTNAFLPHSVVGKLASRDCFLALGAAFEVFMLGALTQEMGI